MKKQYVPYLIVATIVIGFFAYSVVIYINKNKTDTTASTAQEISLSAVLNHSEPSNCWIIIGSKVYSLSAYNINHPDDVTYAIYCGKDATQQLTPGTPSKESNMRLEKLQPYYIGILTPNYCGSSTMSIT